MTQHSAIDHTGITAGVPEKLGAQIYRSTAQAINTATAAISFDTEVYDVGGFWVIGSPTRLTIPSGGDGLYLVTYNGFHDATGVSWAGFKVGGADVRGSGKNEPDQGSGYHAATAQFDLVATNYVEVFLSTSASINIGHASALDAQCTVTITRIAD